MCFCLHQDWIEFEEIADLEERAKSQFFEKENEVEVQKNQAAAKEKEVQRVKATKDQVEEVRRRGGHIFAALYSDVLVIIISMILQS